MDALTRRTLEETVWKRLLATVGEAQARKAIVILYDNGAGHNGSCTFFDATRAACYEIRAVFNGYQTERVNF